MIFSWITCAFSTYTMCFVKVRNKCTKPTLRKPTNYLEMYVTKMARQNLGPLPKVQFLVPCI